MFPWNVTGIYAAYAVAIGIFGQTPAGVHMGLLFVNACTSIFIFLLARRLFNPVVAVISAASFATLSISQAMQGVYANAEHFVILPAVAGMLLLHIALEKKYWAWHLIAGLFLGLAFVIKQHGVVFILAGMAIFTARSLSEHSKLDKILYRNASSLGAGIFLPFVVVCLIYVAAGSFGQFWFWTFDYAKTYATQVSAKVAFDNFFLDTAKVFAVGWPLWVLAAAGLVLPLLSDKVWSDKVWCEKVKANSHYLTLFALFSFLGIFPGFYFRVHYFVLMLPAVAILIGVAVYSLLYVKKLKIIRKGGVNAVLVMFAVAIGVTLYQQRLYLFGLTPYAVTRTIYGINPFPEAITIAEYIKQNSTKNDLIAVVGSEPEIYFYAQRRAATGYVYTYSLMEGHEYALKMQQQMIREIEQSKPLFIVYLDPRAMPWSWLPIKESHKDLFYWFEKYRADNYTRVGLIQFFIDGTTFAWNENALIKPRSQVWLEVLKRKPSNDIKRADGDTVPPSIPSPNTSAQ